MTFTETIKEEIVNLNIRDNLKYAHLWSYFKLFLKNNEIIIKSKKIYLANYLKKICSDLNIPYIENEKNIIINDNKILQSLNDYRKDMEINNEHFITLLRISFLAYGSINHPESAEYHFEFNFSKPNIALLIQSLFNKKNYNARLLKRKNRYIVYIKEAEKISDFLKLIHCDQCLFQFEDFRIKRDLSNSINRLVNIEIANETKALESANKEIKAIKIVKKIYKTDSLNQKLVEIMDLRMKNPNATLQELSVKYFEKYNKKISKSGINHRLNKIYDLLPEGIDKDSL